MLKQIISYEGFDGKTEVDTLYFNLTKAELADNLGLEDRFRDMAKMFQPPVRELTRSELEFIIDLVKTFMKLSYGELEGKYFRKTEARWEDFTSTAAYDAFLFSLFEDPEKALNFLVGVFPKDLMDKAQSQMAEQGIELPEIAPAAEAPAEPVKTELTDEQKALIARVDAAPMKASREDLVQAMHLKNLL